MRLEAVGPIKAVVVLAKSGKLQARFLKGAAGTLALRVVFAGSSFLLNILLTRLMGASGFGAYAYAFAWVTLLGMPAVLGMDQLLVRELAAYRATSEWGRMRGLLRRANQAVFLASIGLVALAGAISWLLRSRLDPLTLTTFWVALAALPLLALTRVRQAALQGLQHVAVGSLPETLVQPMLMLSVVTGVAWTASSLSAPSAMGIRVMVTAVGFLTGAAILNKLLPKPAREADPVYDRIPWAQSILPLMFLAGAGIVNAQADTLMLGGIKGSRAVGFYAVADRSAELINFLMLAVNAALAPAVASIYALKDTRRLQIAVTKVVRTAFVLSLPVGLVLIAFGRWWLFYLYGAAFTRGQAALAILSVSQLICSAAGPGGLLLIMTGHERDAGRAIFTSAVTNIALCAALVPAWDMEGAAIAAGSSAILLNILLARSARRRLNIHPTLLGAL